MSLTRMGSFSGSDIPSREGAFDVEAFLKVKKFSELTKKLGAILPLGKLKHMRNWVLACDYYAEGGTQNLKNLLLFMLKEYCGKKVKVQPPQKMLDWGIWWPDQYFDDLKSFTSWRPMDENKPTVGIFFYGGCILLIVHLQWKLWWREWRTKSTCSLFFRKPEGQLTVQAGKIEAKAEKSEVQALEDDLSSVSDQVGTLTTSYDSISARVTSVEGVTDDLTDEVSG